MIKTYMSSVRMMGQSDFSLDPAKPLLMVGLFRWLLGQKGELLDIMELGKKM
jgi:hypothetical protein